MLGHFPVAGGAIDDIFSRPNSLTGAITLNVIAVPRITSPATSLTRIQTVPKTPVTEGAN